MLFHSLQFLIFLPVVFFLYWNMAKSKRARLWLLFTASMVFYMAWNPAPVLLILYLSTTDFFIAQWLGRGDFTERRRKAFITLSVTNNLVVLCVFKYADWVTQSVVDVFSLFGVDLVYQPLGLVLPVGLSFVVFQCMSYTIDVYRGELSPRKSWLEVTTYIAFFPQVVAGPIVRAADFLPQMDKTPTLPEHAGGIALYRIAMGMFKKLIIADMLAANLIDRVFTTPENYTGLEVMAGIFCYTVQIYYDFSAYSDIAIGVAALFGFHIKENFDKPYLSANLFEFWRRWHISLGAWLRDYLYIPLGGNRKNKFRICWNLWVTMILGSVWHGADWRFVVWGVIHGIALIWNRVWWWVFGRPAPNRSLWIKLATGTLTFFIVMEARIVFRAENIQIAWNVFLEQRRFLPSQEAILPIALLAVIGFGLCFMVYLASQAVYHWFYRLPLHPKLPLKVFLTMASVFMCIQAGMLFDMPFLSPGNTDFSAFKMENYLAPNLTPQVLWVMILAVVGHIIPHRFYHWLGETFVVLPIPARAFALVLLTILVKQVLSFEVQPFIYFQF